MPKLHIQIDSKSFGDHEIIKDFVLEAEEGEVIAILGPSGIGKTTLLRIIGGLEKNYSGSVIFDNRIISKPCKDIQLLFQDYRLLPWKTVRENICLADDTNECHDAKRLQYWLATMGLSAKADAWPKTLSGGQESRTALARAFYANPRLLLFDEPFQNLDADTKRPIMRTLRETLVAKKITTILVTHNAEDAELLADTIYELTGSPLKISSKKIK